MSAERGQGRGWVRIPASRAETPGRTRTAGPGAPSPYGSPYDTPYGSPPSAAAPPSYGSPPPYGSPYAPPPAASPADRSTIYLSLVKRWQEAGRTLPGHPDEEWERLVSQPYWPGR
ncbi:hypothetical protein [Streptomyces sp. NPDC051567]|uniref:hypothetical protein n=1 Tax=Streptomyces sp. NPDC051567 TaxID=3365660 RepID=UPI00379F3490